MCGICGFAGRDDQALLERMTASLAHRGPDDSGTKQFAAVNGAPPVGLGHRRLSIIDPTPRGHQPLSYADQRLWLTYNGEIYNFKSLRDELLADGFRFHSETDSEVLLALYARDGVRMVERLNGIFAFAIWDTVACELVLVRDRLGVKPFYYALSGEALFFGSEVKALLPALGSASLNLAAAADFLTLLSVPGPDNLIEGVQTLAPGHLARFRDGRLSIEQYWDFEFDVDPEPSDREWATRTRIEVQSAVERQMVSDVPLGAFLSGGLDSGAVVATMREHSDEVSTFTVGFSEEDLAHEIVPDDLKYARKLAADLELEYNERILEADVVDLLPRLIWHLDDPVSDPAVITTYLICRSASERLKVVLSGMGADEVFAGYSRYLAAKLMRPIDALPASFRRRLRGGIDPRLSMGKPGRLRGPRRNLMKLMRGFDQDHLQRYLTYNSYYRREELDRALAPAARESLSSHDPYRHHRDHAARAADQHWLHQLLYVDLKVYLPCHNLAYTDKMSMAASTEVRVPFLDDGLISMLQSMPAEQKLHRMTRKYALKKSMEPVLPKEIIWRPKAGFGAPVRAWLGNELRPLVDELLSPATIRRRGLLDPDEVRRMIAANDSGREDNALRIWTLLVLELWQQRFLDRDATGGGRVA